MTYSNLKIREEKELHSKTETELAEQYQYLVSKIAEQFKEASESQENLEEVGYIGLLNAVNLYDKNIHQMNFKTYAQILITEEMHEYLMNKTRQVDRPNWLVKLNHKIDNFVIEYREKYQHFPQISEIAEHLNINTFGLQEVLKARDSLRENHFSKQQLDQQIDLSQIQPNLENIKSNSYQSFKLPIEDLIALQKALKKIKKLQEDIVYYLFVMDLSETKLASMLGISNQKASQIKKEALNHLQ
jgi:RNA polymerase sigma-B factor